MARLLARLPFYDARMSSTRSGDAVHYASERTHRGAPAAAFRGTFRPIGPVAQSSPGTLDHWLTERYCLYTTHRHGQVWRCDIHHVQWPLQLAAAEVEVNTMLRQIGLTLPDTPPLLHFARRLDIVAWPLSRV